MRTIFCFFLISLCLTVFSSPHNPKGYAAISEELKKGADVIKNKEVVEVTILSPGKAVIRNFYSLTILNDKADHFAVFTQFYDKFQSISDIEGKLFDANGKELKKVKKRDISDLSAETGMDISDNRIKQHSFGHTVYPYTVEYFCELELNGIFWLPGWVPQESMKMGVLESKLIVKVPAGYKLRYKEYNLSDAVKQMETGAGGVYSWQATTLKPKKSEPFMPHWARERPCVALAPSDFEIEGIKGNMNSWQQFGQFVYQLTGNRDGLPSDIAFKAKQMTAGMKTPYEKIDTLYKFLQNNTRYISIQLGIGGWQPIPAAKVAQIGYGDCKALTNYMYALLREVGIESKYTLVNSGDEGLYTDASFVSSQWNHAILSVPMGKDTIWLECTSSILPAGYMGEGTYNRPALIVDEKGGTLVRTPNYKKGENLQIRNIQATLDETGNLNARINTKYTALQQDYLHWVAKTAEPDWILKYQRNRFDIPTYDLVNYHFDTKPGIIPELYEEVNITALSYAQVSGKRIFILPNIATRSGTKLTADSARFFDIEMDYDYLDVDTVVIKVPDGYAIEALPKEIREVSQFGEYNCKITFADNKVTLIRAIHKNNGRYKADQYPELVKFYQAIQKGDKAKVVLVKKE